MKRVVDIVLTVITALCLQPLRVEALVIPRGSTVRFASASLVVAESGVENDIAAERSGDLSAAASVRIQVQDLSTDPTKDYQLSSLTMEFAPGEMNSRIGTLDPGFQAMGLPSSPNLDQGARLDSSFAPRFEFSFIRAYRPVVNAILRVDDGSFLVGGQFDQVNGIARTNLVGLTGRGEVDLGFTAPAANGFSGSSPLSLGAVTALAVDGFGRSLMIMASDRRPTCRTHVRLRHDGSVDAGFVDPGLPQNPGRPGLFLSIQCVTVHPDGSVLVGGEFDRVHAMSLRGLARLNGGVKGFEFGATVWNADEGAALRFEMPRGQSHRLQASEDLASWTDLFGGRVLLNETTLKDVQSIGNTKRYYRALRGE